MVVMRIVPGAFAVQSIGNETDTNPFTAACCAFTRSTSCITPSFGSKYE
jgi:hypothetical protein